MKIGFVIVFSVIIIIFAAINYYIFRRFMSAIPDSFQFTNYLAILFIVVSASYLVGRFLERVWISPLSDVLVWVGSFWLGAMVYFLFIVAFLDILRLFNHFLHFLPAFIYTDYQKTKLITAIISIILVGATILYGYINAMNTKIVDLAWHVNKKVSGMKELKIAVASDIHLGTMVSRARLDNLIEKINHLHPDIILFAGDIVDEDLRPVIRQNLGDAFRNLKSKYGTYAITGNHEYIGGAEPAVKYLTEHGITFLRDTTAVIDGKFVLIGREDRSSTSFGGRKRKALDELMSYVDKSLPTILLDHQPFNLEQAEQNGIDVQFSGHTHNGQIFPFNYITQKVYELSWGYLKKGATHIYVSSGLGTWGPPLKIGNDSEILNVTIKFNE